MKRWLGFTLAVVTALSVPLWKAPVLQAADVLITFDDLPAPPDGGRPLRNEYQVQGVVFGWSPTASNARTVYLLKPTRYAAHSGSQVGLIEQSGHCGVENPANDAWARFTSLRHHVQVYVTSLLGDATVVLQGVSAGGQAVAGTSTHVRGGEWNLLSITRAQGDIAFIHILGNPPSTGCIAIDDLSFDAPVGAGPDFGLAFYALDIGASPGHSGTGTIVVNRFNNSSGRIDFSTSGQPPGVSASFSPQPLTGSSLSANVTLTLHIAGNAPAAVDVPVTVTGKALDTSAGDPAQPRSVVIPVTVASEYTLVVKGIEVTQGIQAAIGRDAVQPGAHRGTLLEPVKPPPGRQQGLLEHVFRVLHRAEDPVAVQLQLAPVRVGEFPERIPVARPGPGERRHGHVPHPRTASSFRPACKDTIRGRKSSVSSCRRRCLNKQPPDNANRRTRGYQGQADRR